MSSSSDHATGDGGSLDIVMVEMIKSTKACTDLVVISNAVTALMDELKQERLTLLQKQATFVEAAGKVYPALCLERVRPYLGLYFAIESTYKAVVAGADAFYAKILDCEQKKLAKSKAIVAPIKLMSLDFVLRMSADDHQRMFMQLEEDKKKIVEVKSFIENVKAEWESTKESLNADLNRCIQGINILLQLVQLFQKASEE